MIVAVIALAVGLASPAPLQAAPDNQASAAVAKGKAKGKKGKHHKKNGKHGKKHGKRHGKKKG